MNKQHILKVSPLVGAVLLALSAPMAMAQTAPGVNVLPGAFYTNNANVTYNPVAGSSTSAIVSVAGGPTVLQFGGTSANVTNLITAPTTITTAAGFNIGASAALTVSNTASATAAVLINDITGNPSQIYGTLTATAATASYAPTLFVANANGVIIGSGAKINLATGGGIIGEGQDPSIFMTAGDVYYSTGTGPVTIMSGATINVTGNLLVAGNGNVNVGALNGTATVIAGYNFSAGSTANSVTQAGPAISTATVNFNGGSNGTPLTATVNAAGNVNVLGGSFVSLNNGTTSNPATTNGLIGGTFTNNGTVTLATGFSVGGAFVNSGTLNEAASGTVSAGTSFTNSGTITNIGTVSAAAGAFTNNGTITDTSSGAFNVSAGNIVNAGTMTGDGFSLTASTGTIVNNGTLNANNGTAGGVTLTASSTAGGGISNAGTIQNIGATGLSATASSSSFSNTGTLNFSAANAPLTISATNGNVNLVGTVNMGTNGTALSSTQTLGLVTVNAGTSTGYINLGTLLYAAGGNSTLGAATIHVASNGGFVDNTANDSLTVDIGSGTNGGYGYNLGMAGGSVLAAPTVNVVGSTTGSNVFLGGVLGNSTTTGKIDITANNIDGNGTGTNYGFAVSNAGALNITAGGNVANTYQGFTPLFNYLRSIPVDTGSSSGTVTITTDVTNSGTAQYVNLAVNGSPTMSSDNVSPITTTNGAIGVSNAAVPFGQVALQATGNITNDGFYFPGRIVEANIQSVGSSTFGLNNANTISVSNSSSLSNVVPGVVSSAGMILLTDQPIALPNTSYLLTNTNSWYNFPASPNLSMFYSVVNPGFYAATYANGTLTSTLVSTKNTPNNQFYGLTVMP